MEETVSERQTTMESLRSQLAAVLEEHALCGRELGGRREGVESQGDAVEGEGCVRCVCVVCVCVHVWLVAKVTPCYPTHTL